MSARRLSLGLATGALWLAMAAAASAEKVLYFRETSVAPDRLAQALNALGHDVTATGSSADFAAQLATGGFELGVCFIQQRPAAEHAAAVRALSSFVAAGGRGLYADWSRDAALAAELGAAFTGRGDQRQLTPLALEPGSTPLPAVVTLRNTGWFRPTSGLAPLTGSTVAARFENGDAAIIRGGSGRSLVCGFLNDTPASAAIFARAIEAVLGTSGSPIISPPALRGVAVHAATISATLAANNFPTDVVIEFGPTPSYGRRTTPRRIRAGAGIFKLTETLTGLAAHTEVHYRISARNRAGLTQTGDLTFTTANSAPIAHGDVFFARAPGAFTLSPLANDRDPNGDPLKIVAVTSGQFGAVTFDDSTITYTPANADVLRADSFTYTVEDGFGGSATARVAVLMRVGFFFGEYTQLITGPSGIVGRLHLLVNPHGAFTGQLFFNGGVQVLRGGFGPAGRVQIARSGFVLTLDLELAGATPRIVGNINGETIAAAAVRSTDLPPLARGGHYTLAVAEVAQAGEAWAIFSGNAAGRLRLSGRFADGAPFSGTTSLQPDGTAPIFLQRRAPVAESLAGTLQFSGPGGATVSGALTWQRAAFTATSQATGARFIPPARTQSIFTFSNAAVRRATATLDANAPGFPLERTVAVGLAQLRVAAAPTELFRLGLSRTNGLCIGSFRHPTLGPCRLSGVLLPGENVVRGNFSTARQSGLFRLTPQ